MSKFSTEDEYVNAYRCPRCLTEWQETAAAACNSECPDCGLSDIMPARSDSVTINPE